MKAIKNFISAVQSDSRIETGKESADKLTCENIGGLLDNYLLEQNAGKVNHLDTCKGEEVCECSGGSGSSGGGKVDLIVLIDCSGSMSGFAKGVSDAASKAIEVAKAKCETDLRISFMGVEGVWTGTQFTTNHLAYLQAIDSTVTFAANTGAVGYRTEQGANAVQDLSNYYDWRDNACRAIFYISDEELDGSSPRADYANETLATDAAIAAANTNRVTVFANHITHQGLPAQIKKNYSDLCTSTGGKYYESAAPNTDAYVEMLSEVICSACGSKCKTAEVPDLHPCISITWGDSDCDCVETDDFEVMHVNVSNCYDNITFKDFSIGYLYVTDESGKTVPALPDGSLSVQIFPIGPYCFGDIGPCVDGKPTSKSRQFVLSTRGAKSGKYRISVGVICYEVAFHYDSEACFEVLLCKS